MQTSYVKQKQQTKINSISGKTQTVLSALALFLIWMFATYMLEGRIDLMHHPDALNRFIYVITANVLIGVFGSFWILRRGLSLDITRKKDLGFRSLDRSLIACFIALVTGLGLFLLQGPPALDPLVIFNGFALVLPVSIAEIVVCWAVIGGTFEAWAKSKGKIIGVIVGIVASDLLFGFYHYAHSAPFNQLWMVMFLMIPGLVTGLIYFLGRDLYATILFHNFLGMTGVMQNADLERFQQPMLHLYIILIIAVVTLVALDQGLIRNMNNKARNSYS